MLKRDLLTRKIVFFSCFQPIKARMEAFQREIEMMEVAGRHPHIVAILGATKDSRVIVFEQAWTDLQVRS